MKIYNVEIIRIAKKYIFHKQSCLLGIANGEEGDFCSCNIRKRREALANEITEIIAKQKDKIKRRNKQIKDLKEEIKALQSGNYSTDFEIQQ